MDKNIVHSEEEVSLVIHNGQLLYTASTVLNHYKHHHADVKPRSDFLFRPENPTVRTQCKKSFAFAPPPKSERAKT